MTCKIDKYENMTNDRLLYQPVLHFQKHHKPVHIVQIIGANDLYDLLRLVIFLGNAAQDN